MAKAKIVKRKKRKLKVEGLATLMLTLAVVAFLGARYGLKSYNYNLAVKKNQIQQEEKALQESVANLQAEVTDLSQRERILKAVEKENLTTNQDNITMINGNKE